MLSRQYIQTGLVTWRFSTQEVVPVDRVVCLDDAGLESLEIAPSTSEHEPPTGVDNEMAGADP